MKPMRLVDIGNLTIKIQYPRCNGKTVVIDAINKALNELPTVDAIPAEFIEKRAQEYASNPEDSADLFAAEVIQMIVTAWRAERKEQ